VASKYCSLYQIETRLRDSLTRPLPGSAAHIKLSPRPRRGWHPSKIKPGAKKAAVLILLYPNNDAPHLLLTLRSETLPQHKDQVSFPGGKVEPKESTEEAALRETMEEIGVRSKHIQLLGSLSPLYIPVSNFSLHPVIGIAHDRLIFNRQKKEVSRILEVPLQSILSEKYNPRKGFIWRNNTCIHIPYFQLKEERVWGATAMILSELVDLLEDHLTDPLEPNVHNLNI